MNTWCGSDAVSMNRAGGASYPEHLDLLQVMAGNGQHVDCPLSASGQRCIGKRESRGVQFAQ